MGVCWSCYWGWPKPVYDIYRNALDALNGHWPPLHFGPAHTVWEDENFDLAERCLADFDEYSEGYSEDQLRIVQKSLEELAALPLKVRCVEPDDYDEEHPEAYPPPAGIEMIHPFCDSDS